MEILIIQIKVAIGFILLGYSWSRLARRNDIADILWSLGFLATGLAAFDWSVKADVQKWVFLCCLALWAIRLSMYLAVRNLSKPEDKRYLGWRKDWGSKEPVNALIRVFFLQAILMAFISYPIVGFLTSESLEPVGPLKFVGLILFCLGFLIETSADFDLFEFKKSKTQGICRVGLWGQSRHPNYFGEILVWWGLATMATGTQLGYWVYLSPLFLTFLLVRVSGVTMTDRQMQISQGTDFEKYKSRTAALIPFNLKQVFIFLALAVFILVVDVLFIGFAAGDFFREQLFELGRINSQGDGFDAVIWAMVMVYFCLPLGVYFFSKCEQNTYGSVLLSGGIYGLSAYGIYEFTNLALIKNWPIEMAFVDILWGTVLSSMSALFVCFLKKQTNHRT